jgi:hypothetical protein
VNDVSASDAVDAFAGCRDRLETLIGFLDGCAAAAMGHAELEQRVALDGREVLRLALQGHLDVRAEREQRNDDVYDSDGVARRSVEAGHQRTLTTVFGEVIVARLAYRQRGHPNLHPADGALNLPVERYSHGLRELAGIEAARGSFDAAVEAIGRSTGQAVGKRQVEQLVTRAATDFEAFYARSPRGDVTGDVLVLSADGKGIVMRPDELRPATAHAAATTTTKLASRLSKGEKRNRKRLAEVGAVYELTPLPRTATDIVATTDHAAAPTPAPVAKNKWLIASVAENATTVIARIFAEAQRRDPDQQRAWVALVDGNNHQIQRITTEAKARGVTVTIIVDVIHVIEYLWRAAWCFFDEGDTTAEHWVRNKTLAVLNGNASTVAASIRRKATCLHLTPPNAPTPTPAPTTCSANAPISTTRPHSPTDGPSPPASSKAPADTSSKTAWTSPAPAGPPTAPKPSSNSAPSTPTTTSLPTGNTTSHKNNNASTKPATSTAPSHEPHNITPKEPHPYDIAARLVVPAADFPAAPRPMRRHDANRIPTRAWGCRDGVSSMRAVGRTGSSRLRRPGRSW